MKFFKQNPIFSVLVSLFVVLFIVGVVLIFMVKGGADKESKSVSRAESNLRAGLSLSPAPTQENIEAVEKNLVELKSALEKQVAATQGNKPGLLNQSPPTTGTEMLFQLKGYAEDLAKLADRTVPINVSDAELEVMQEFGSEIPSVEIPENFAFGFSRYNDTGKPPADKDVPVVHEQMEILNYTLRKLFNTRPISIVAVNRGPAEREEDMADANQPSARNAATIKAAKDEFMIGSETARIKGAVDTLAFKIVFTGYTVNLRSFLKQIEAFEIPLVVRAVEVTPVEQSVRVAGRGGDSGGGTQDLFAIFDQASPEEDEAETEVKGKDPIVAENESEFTVVLEYITVTISDEKPEEEDLS